MYIIKYTESFMIILQKLGTPVHSRFICNFFRTVFLFSDCGPFEQST